MNIRCPGCGATAEYSPKDLKMICKHCGKIFLASEATGKGVPEEKEAEKKDATAAAGKKRAARYEQRQHAVIKMHTYHCSSCGAELLANSAEVTTCCYYCGQPVVMEEKLADYLEPDYIIPFKLTQEEAIERITSEIKNGLFVPHCFKQFEVKRLTPIYVPFWLIEMDYEDHQVWRYREKQGKNHYVDRFVNAGAHVRTDNFTVDGSSRLEDLAGERIGPFDLSGMVPFDPAYLSGFYADRYDMGTKDVEKFAVDSIHEMFDDKMREKMAKISSDLYSSDPKHKILKTDYVFCPVWFLTVTMENRIYTMFVNGQTGKVVYAIPPSKKKALAAFFIMFAATTALYTACMGPFAKGLIETARGMRGMVVDEITSRICSGILVLSYMIPLISGLASWGKARKQKKMLKRDLVQINGESNLHYVQDRGTDAFSK